MRHVAASAELRKMLWVLQLIVAVVHVGLLAFLAATAWWHHGPRAPEFPEHASYFTYVAVALGFTQPLVFTVVRMALARQAAQAYDPADSGRFRAKYIAAVIVGAAGIEAAGLLSAVAYLLEGRLAALIAGGVCALVLLLAIPTQRGVDKVIDSKP